MSKQTHTPEPWEAAGQTIMNKAGHFLFVACDSTVNGERISDDEQTANTRRAVACVNAYAGLTNGQLSELPEIIDEGTVAKQERNELASALEAIASLHPKDFKGGREEAYAEAAKIAIGAVAKYYKI